MDGGTFRVPDELHDLIAVLLRAIGCYTSMHEGRPHIQPAGFVLGPDGRVVRAVYSSGRVGRLTAGDALTIMKDL